MMRKKIRRKPRRSQIWKTVDQINAMTEEEVLDEMLTAGNGLFWEIENGQVRPYSRTVVEVGLSSMWNLWADLESLASAP